MKILVALMWSIWEEKNFCRGDNHLKYQEWSLTSKNP
jgi:hypothetical protein